MKKISLSSVLLILLTKLAVICNAEEGIESNTIYFGSVLALKGQARDLGLGMKTGLNAALKGQTVNGLKIEVLYRNDNYEPDMAVKATQELINKPVFLMIGNIGTPTAKVTLPLLAAHNIPAVGFFTGAGLLRPGVAPTVNYRASYVQETGAVIKAAIQNGIGPEAVCAYVQNDAYGMAGLVGVKNALASHNKTEQVVKVLDKIINITGDNPERNNIGPVGTYKRNTKDVIDGYKSLKTWEKNNGTKCKLVVTVGAYENIAKFIWYANYKKSENWIVSAVSFTGADNLKKFLSHYKASRNVLMTQVVPLIDSAIPIVEEAKKKIGRRFGYVSLEGYIVGKMVLHILREVSSPITREKFLAKARQSKFDLGGVIIDFTKNGYQGSDKVEISVLGHDGFESLASDFWKN
ncbi:ABC transporter substrate-binding protein [Endozoicomonas sp. SM1973]|uniref:ABC transporter substrate-binding protein n=1 Tax=Spartinivicinus marinus TaxID=2994442 RepID=A0A853I1H8_9GAMM|nr:ABC transporter substrate-binding protein [Spartinivicinus marinus]MCX4026392.1 ABC transporter substrate-binding protein [Spartinivicinus marinus]NYZ67263.1 ABC transporter substrate-binding protein [Spartinivicinus marinus]